MTLGFWIPLLYVLGVVPYAAFIWFGFLLASRDLRRLALAAFVAALVVASAHAASSVVQLYVNHPSFSYPWRALLFNLGFELVYWTAIAVIAACLVTWFRRRRRARGEIAAPIVDV